MKKISIIFCATIMLVVQAWCAQALTSGQTWKIWVDAQHARQRAEITYRQAILDDQQHKTPENDQKVVDTGKTMLNAWLDEAQAWLEWKDREAQENPDVPNGIRDDIHTDVAKNLAKIDGLRKDVSAINTVPQGVAVWVKMVGSYLELLVDVARNTGAMWVAVGDKILDTADGYEARLRAAADKISDNTVIIQKLDSAKTELNSARELVQQADVVYKKVILPGTPLINFNQGNVYLLQAKEHLLNAQAQMVAAFNLIIPNP